jgi:NADP+-dependent farnesol dehydrogenase
LRVGLIKIKGQLNAVECDIANEQSVQTAFTWVEKTFGGVDLLVNNGGVYTKALFTDENNSRELKNIIDNEILGNILCTRQTVKSMKTRDVNGHIVNINSIFGHTVNQAVPGNKPMNSLYPPAKHAIAAVTECIRQELLYLQTQIKITVSNFLYSKICFMSLIEIILQSISPGLCEQDIITSCTDNELVALMPKLKPEDIANTVLFCITLPDTINVHEMVLKPIGEFV